MADIIIRGMEMPRENRVKVLLLHADGTVIEHIGPFTEIPSGKAIELPEHGDLIDRSELSVVYYEGTEGLPDDFDHGVAWLLEHIDKLEPIIPASGGDEA